MTEQDLVVGVMRVESLVELRRFEDARTMARELLARDPGNARLLELLAFCSIELRDHRAALDDAKRFLATSPDQAVAHELMAVALHNRRQFKRSVEAAERAMALEPTNPAYRVQLSAMLIDYAQHGVTVVRQAALRREAARQADAARHLAPADVEPYLALARAGLAMGDEAGAREMVEQALVIDPQDHRAHQLLGEVALADRKVAQAGDHFVDAGRLEPQDRHNVELLRRASGDWFFRSALVVGVLAVVRFWLLGRLVVGLIVGAIIVTVAVIVRLVRTARLSAGARAALARERETRRRR